MIAVIDYGAGNIKSVGNALKYLGYEFKRVSQKQGILDAGIIILPGVGAGGETIENLCRLDLADTIRRVIEEDRPFLGICIGLQVLFTGTDENGGHECLGVLPGRVRRLPSGQKVPHMGWNQVRQVNKHPVFAGIPDNDYFYFVHSYFPAPDDKGIIIGETEYGLAFASAIARRNLVATQFHPEKSGAAGLKFYENFLKSALKKG